MPIVLNQGQKEASQAFYKFLFNDDKEFIISGPGGTGKTLLMGHLIDTILPEYHQTCKIMGITPEYDSVEMTATTNKAAEALSLATKRPTSTIHSFLNLKVQDDYETGVQRLSRTGNWVVHQRKIIFIDECSMIDGSLLSAIHEGTHCCKIVYVGDHCQLAPVKETLSPIYTLGLPVYELTEPMRNAGQPALMALCNQLRRTVETMDFQPIKIVLGVIDWLEGPTMEAKLNSVFQTQAHHSRLLAYTNKQVVAVNDYIRDARSLGEEYTTGEALISNSAMRMKTRMLSVEEGVTIINQAANTEMVPISTDAYLEVRRTDLLSNLGDRFNDVLLPVDRKHFSDLIRYYQQRKNWERYFYLKNTFPDLRQRDAATVHKAQGSTYDSVFIDLTNISTCNIPNQVSRMLYVAASRPRQNIVLYGNLADKYGGLQF